MAEQNEKEQNDVIRRLRWGNLPLYIKIPIIWFWINTVLYIGVLLLVIIIFVFNINI